VAGHRGALRGETLTGLARRAIGRPATLAALFLGAIALGLLATHAWDPLFFATLGPQWERHDPALRMQADGTIFYEFAVDPAGAARHHARFRTARILYPLLARALALGQAALVPWTLLLINVAAIALGTEVVHRLLERRGLPAWPALAYGGWLGLGLAMLHDTSEPLAYLCALLGIASLDEDRAALAAACCLGALLTRETTVLLVAPYLLLGDDRRGRKRWPLGLAVLAAWGVWLLAIAVAGVGPSSPRPLTALPLAGFRATRPIDLPATLVFLVLPALVALGLALWQLRRRPADAALWAVALNALLVVWLPPRTAKLLWHSGRISTGLVAATLVALPLAASFPRLWRALAALFAASAAWTAAVTVRYLVWDVRGW
jgi:hypothetical protein